MTQSNAFSQAVILSHYFMVDPSLPDVEGNEREMVKMKSVTPRY
jgi:hypothetical protein